MPDDSTRARNPIQKVQGYIELGGTPVTTTTDKEEQTVIVQQLLPDKHVRLVYAGTNDDAPMYRANGTRLSDPYVRADDQAFYSFYAETGQYDIRFTELSNDPIVEIFRKTDVKIESRTYNVRDYGAKGDGVADDTLALRKALQTMIDAYSSINGVGKLFFPNGKYLVTKQADLLKYILDLPSGIVIEGTAGPVTGGNVSNCQIVLGSPDCSIFHIGTNRHKIIFRDIGLTTTDSHANTIAIDAREIEANFAGTNTTGVELDNVTIWDFDRGFSVEGSGVNLQWDITGTRISHSTIVDCNYAVYLNSQNCDFVKLTDSRIGAAVYGFGIFMEKVGNITIDNILGAGATDPPTHRRADSFIYMTPAHATVTIINSECEGFLRAIALEANVNGNIGWPIMVLNSTFGDIIALSHNCDYISLSNRYEPGIVQCRDNGTDVMIYSVGDICAHFSTTDIPQPGDNPFVLIGNSRLVSRSNRFRVDFGQPARFGGQAGFITPIERMTLPLAVSAFSDDGAQVSLCDKEGRALFILHADKQFLYFERSDTGEKLMSLDNDGNLTLKGVLTQSATP